MAQPQNKIVHKVISEEDKMPEIQALTLRAQDFSQSVGRWNTAMIWALVFAALAAIAVVVTTRMALKRTKQLADVQDELIRAKDKQLALDFKDKDLKIAEAGEKAATAESKAEGFRLDIAKANERAAQATLELAKLKTPRSLNPAKQEHISEALKVFAGTHFDMAVNNDVEAQGLLLPIENTLKAAGWVEIDWKRGDNFAEINFVRKGQPAVGLASISGLVIQMHPEEVSSLGNAAQALAAALNGQGIAARAEPGLGFPNVNTKAIHIIIGEKPK